MAQTIGTVFSLNPQADGLLYTENIPEPPTDTVLSQAAASLSPGGLMDLNGIIPSLASQQIAEGRTQGYTSWQTRNYYDAINRRVVNWSKDKSGNPTLLDTYDEVSNTWSRPMSFPTGNGHPYGNHTMDYATGDSYYQIWGTSTPHKVRGSDGSYSGNDLTPYPIETWPANGLCWHPNLYGPGIGGLIICWTLRFYFWNSQTDVWEQSSGIPFRSNISYCQGEYLGATDEAIYPWGQLDGGSPSDISYKVTPNGGNTPIVTEITDPPIRVHAGSSATTAAGLIRDPRNPDNLLLVQHASSVWSTSDGVTWNAEPNHPFSPAGVGTVYTSMPIYGVVWVHSGDGRNQLWRPA